MQVRPESERSRLHLEEVLTDILEDHFRAQAKDSSLHADKKTAKKKSKYTKRKSAVAGARHGHILIVFS